MTHLEQPFILTLTLDKALAHTLNQLREAHFPKERNHLDAHVTLFQRLTERARNGFTPRPGDSLLGDAYV